LWCSGLTNGTRCQTAALRRSATVRHAELPARNADVVAAAQALEAAVARDAARAAKAQAADAHAQTLLHRTVLTLRGHVFVGGFLVRVVLGQVVEGHLQAAEVEVVHERELLDDRGHDPAVGLELGQQAVEARLVHGDLEVAVIVGGDLVVRVRVSELGHDQHPHVLHPRAVEARLPAEDQGLTGLHQRQTRLGLLIRHVDVDRTADRHAAEQQEEKDTLVGGHASLPCGYVASTVPATGVTIYNSKKTMQMHGRKVDIFKQTV